MAEPTYVIIGASLAGAKAAETLRTEGFAGRVVLIGDETERPYERPPLSKGYLLGSDERDKAFVHDEQWYAQNGIDLLLGRRATALDRGGHTVTLDGVEPLNYDKLLLATGSRIRTLDVSGADLRDVRYLRTIDQADALLGALRTGGSVVVVGAGWIGLEVAAAARSHGCEVAIVETARLPLQRVLGDEVAAVFRDLHVAHGVEFRFEVGVREFGDLRDRLTSVVLDDDSELPADVAVVGIGIRPATELAETAGLAVDDGVITDEALRTSDPDIYACGDVAASWHPLLQTRVRVEHWANALNGGPAAARSMLGQPVTYDRLPYFFSDQYDLSMEYSGYVRPHGYRQVVFRGDPSVVHGQPPEFLAFWLDADSRVLAGMNVNVWDVSDPIQQLVRTRRPVDPARLADRDVPLGELALK